MARRFPFITSFAAGEIAEEYQMRTDLQVRNEACRQFRNAQTLAGGGFRRRYGTNHVAALTALTRLETYGVGTDDARLLLFSANKFEVRDLAGAIIQTISSSVPWVAADLFTMQVAIEDGKIVVASRSFAPRILTLTGSTWAISTLSFADGLNGSKLQPYWRFAARGVSLTPSAYTGSGVTLTTSAAFFDADHVGTRLRYTGIEVTVTGYTSTTVATGTVVGSLYPTLTVTVGSSTGFLVGQEVQGEDSQVTGVVAGVPGGTSLTVQLLDGYTYFDATEDLVGPTAKSTISAVALTGTPAATTEWDEALIGVERGYPGACALHRNRLMLGDFPAAQNVMAASATGDITDHVMQSNPDVSRSMIIDHAKSLLQLIEEGHIDALSVAMQMKYLQDVIELAKEKLRLSTMATFFELCAAHGLQPDKHWTYNGQDHVIKFFNGSQIILMDLADLPSDPEFQRFGSIELTDAFVDEAGEVSQKCIDILSSRLRYKLINDKPKLLR